MVQAQMLLAAEEQERHRRVVFIVDEAHLLSPAQLPPHQVHVADALIGQAVEEVEVLL
jgi:hypothetical protein